MEHSQQPKADNKFYIVLIIAFVALIIGAAGLIVGLNRDTTTGSSDGPQTTLPSSNLPGMQSQGSLNEQSEEGQITNPSAPSQAR